MTACRVRLGRSAGPGDRREPGAPLAVEDPQGEESAISTVSAVGAGASAEGERPRFGIAARHAAEHRPRRGDTPGDR